MNDERCGSVMPEPYNRQPRLELQCDLAPYHFDTDHQRTWGNIVTRWEWASWEIHDAKRQQEANDE